MAVSAEVPRRVLITGGAGLVGSHIADELVKLGTEQIRVLDSMVRGRRANLESALASGRVEIIEGDITDPAVVLKATEGMDVVFHQAALRITQCAEMPRLALEVLANGTFNVLEAAVTCKVKKLVAASTASVYGMATSFPTKEDHHPYGNRTFYGASKVFLEGMLRSFNEMYGLNYVALRYFNIYGPRMDIHGVYTEVFVRWMNNIRQGKPPVIFGDGKQTMDFVNVEDVARANVLAALAPVSDDVFNIASSTETSLLDLAECLLKVMESPLKPEFAAERKVNPVPRRLADTQRAATQLGFTAKIGLEEGLRSLVRWWQTELAAS